MKNVNKFPVESRMNPKGYDPELKDGEEEDEECWFINVLVICPPSLPFTNQ